ncbi:MAG: quinone-dependent dihydroorotate dehydrogenase [Polyangiales bacterium]
MYRAILRPLLFRLSPSRAHALAFAGLRVLEHLPPMLALTRAAYRVRAPSIAVTTLGLTFPNPIGLAGGFDKDVRCPHALAALGFGFLELGTVTAKAQAQNPPPNMFRLPADRALINRLGFPNDGALVVAERLRAARARRAFEVPVGVSIGKSRVVEVEPIEPAIDDYLESFRAVRDVADFVVVNVSSPNTKNLRALQGADVARALLEAIGQENERGKRVPLLVKIAPDLDDTALDQLLDVVAATRFDGVVATNTTIKREGLASDAGVVEAIGAGGLSGPPVRARALEVVKRSRERLGAEATIIGVGGVSNVDHVLALKAAGADLVQLYTGFIYEGPGIATRLARDLRALHATKR